TAIFLLGNSIPLLPLVLFAILLISFLFFAILFWYRSVQASGAIRRRLQWLAASTTLSCLSVGLAVTRFFVEDSPLTLALVGSLLLVVNSTALYLGCAPPGWLRQFWLLPELERANRFCNALLLGQATTTTGETVPSQTNAAINQILQY